MCVAESVTNIAEETIGLLDPDILDGVSATEVKSVIDKIAAGTITNFEVIHTVGLYYVLLIKLVPKE